MPKGPPLFGEKVFIHDEMLPKSPGTATGGGPIGHAKRFRMWMNQTQELYAFSLLIVMKAVKASRRHAPASA